MPHLCLHGHFYQPPRGNPFAEDDHADEIGHEPGAEPFNNWNEKVTSECYAPNAALGNFEQISFDVGTNLLRWLERNHPRVAQAMVESDNKYVAQHGVGNALATPAHHTILPLARKRDKACQIRWGIAMFASRFGRQPLGIWLPEMAVDYETLQLLDEAGVRFTILSESQVEGADEGAGPYWVALPNGKRLAVFVRNDALSNQLAFNIQSLGGAGRWARETLVDRRKANSRLTVVAVEGETFGYHHPGEEHFLHWLLSYEAGAVGCTITTLERELRDNPPKGEVRVREFTSWSCPHGLARYAAGCDCTPGPSNWKGALRRALDNFANNIDDLYVATMEDMGLDPWQVRIDYVRVYLKQIDTRQLLEESGWQNPDLPTVNLVTALMRAGHFRQRMYSSSTFRYDDLSRPEVRFSIANAWRAAMLTQQATGEDLYPAFRRDLAQAVSTRTRQSGADLLETIRAEFSR